MFVLFTASHEMDHEKFIIMKKKLKEELRIRARVKFNFLTILIVLYRKEENLCQKYVNQLRHLTC